jgi:hypothetical protein
VNKVRGFALLKGRQPTGNLRVDVDCLRAATALMDRAGLTPAYAVEVRHKADHAQPQVAQPQIEDAERMAREILQSLPTVMAVLPAMEVEAVLSDLPRMT